MSEKASAVIEEDRMSKEMGLWTRLRGLVVTALRKQAQIRAASTYLVNEDGSPELW